jgi:predicted lipid-binding transport protein (Tim44 family)
MVYFPAEQIDFWFVMSQREGFSGGFLLGTIVGGVIGGVVGALLATRQFGDTTGVEEAALNANSLASKTGKKKRLFQASAGSTDIEAARRSLEDKIAQLNEAIDDVRQQLGGVNGGAIGGIKEQPVMKDPRSQS